jgi:hypothetical protein
MPSPDSGTLSTIASVIAAFGAAMLFFRVQREISMSERGEINWIPVADWLLVVATIVSLLLVIVPLTICDPGTTFFKVVPAASCAGSAILLAGYPFAVLAHYRFILRGKRAGARTNPEPPEAWIVAVTAVAAIGTFAWAIAARIWII